MQDINAIVLKDEPFVRQDYNDENQHKNYQYDLSKFNT
jgi:hypothetical protein